MIGAVVQAIGIGSHTFDPIVYHQFGERAVVDIVVDNCLLAPQVQKVVLSAPLVERKNITGVVIGHKSKVNTSKREALGRNSTVSYYDPGNDSLTGLYQAAVQNGLDHVIRVYANCPVLPAWLINKAVRQYFEGDQKGILTSADEYNEGFRIDVFPFWILAEAYTYQENRADIDMDDWTVEHLKNNSSSHIPVVDFDLYFKDLSQAEAMDAIIHNIDNGHDIADVLEENDGDNKKDVEEQLKVSQ